MVLQVFHHRRGEVRDLLEGLSPHSEAVAVNPAGQSKAISAAWSCDVERQKGNIHESGPDGLARISHQVATLHCICTRLQHTSRLPNEICSDFGISIHNQKGPDTF